MESDIKQDGVLEIAPAPQVLILEKDGGLRKSIYLTLRQQGLQVRQAADETGAREILEEAPPDLLVIDRESSRGMTGELIQTFRENNTEGCQVVVLTTSDRIDENWRQEYQPDFVLYKPFDIRFLYRKLIKLLWGPTAENHSVENRSKRQETWH